MVSGFDSFQRSLMPSEDDQIRFEQEIAEISAERDAIEKARLTLLEDHKYLKTEAVDPHNSSQAKTRRSVWPRPYKRPKHEPVKQKKPLDRLAQKPILIFVRNLIDYRLSCRTWRRRVCRRIRCWRQGMH